MENTLVTRRAVAMSGLNPEAFRELKNDPKTVRRLLREQRLTPEEGRVLMGGKPVSEWTIEELARGKPRNEDGTWRGQKPTWVTGEIEEEADRLYHKYILTEMKRGGIHAIARINGLVHDAESDRVSLDASKFVLEHIVGKPRQEVKADVTAKITGILAGVLVNPDLEPATGSAYDYDLDAEEVDEEDEED